jgi:hypothetical protein
MLAGFYYSDNVIEATYIRVQLLNIVLLAFLLGSCGHGSLLLLLLLILLALLLSPLQFALGDLLTGDGIGVQVLGGLAGWGLLVGHICD